MAVAMILINLKQCWQHGSQCFFQKTCTYHIIYIYILHHIAGLTGQTSRSSTYLSKKKQKLLEWSRVLFRSRHSFIEKVNKNWRTMELLNNLLRERRQLIVQCSSGSCQQMHSNHGNHSILMNHGYPISRDVVLPMSSVRRWRTDPKRSLACELPRLEEQRSKATLVTSKKENPLSKPLST